MYDAVERWQNDLVVNCKKWHMTSDDGADAANSRDQNEK